MLLTFCLYGITSKAQKWTPQAAGILPAGYAIYGVSVVDENTAWAVANVDTVTYGPPIPPDHAIKVLKTTDGGQSWSVYDVEESLGRLSWDVQGLDGNTAWLTTQDYGTGLGRALYKTGDGGETWEQKLFHRAAGVFVKPLSEQHIYCQNGRFAAWTQDGGDNWVFDTLTAYAPDEFNILTSGSNMAAAIGDTVWVGTNKGRVCRATNYGQHIEMFDIGQGDDAEIYTIAFSDHLNGMLQTWKPDGSAQLLKSADGGATWQLTAAQPPANGLTYNISAVPGLRGVFVLISDGYSTSMSNTVNSFYTTDFGESLIPLPAFSGTSNAISLSSLRTGWAAVGVIEDDTTPAFYQWDGSDLYGRLFVRASATGGNNGLNWANAFTDLQDALNVADEGSEIWAAAGTYAPAGSGGATDATFLIDKNIRLLGGFAGDETEAEARDPEANPTILSGDLNGDDVADDFAENRGDNVLHVITITNAVGNETLIDGFTVSGGHAGGESSPATFGGGMYSEGAPVVRSCVFTQNFCLDLGGGLIFINTPEGEAAMVEDCVFADNKGNAGGAVCLRFTAASFVDCSFVGNEAKDEGAAPFEQNGGAIQTRNARLSLNHCTFRENNSKGIGGAFLFFVDADGEGFTLRMDSCILENNTGSYGSAVFSQNFGRATSVTLARSTFKDNQSLGAYGSLLAYNQLAGAYGSVWIDQCVFEGNSSQYGSGAIDIGSGPGAGASEYAITNCIFKENSAGTIGGALGLWSELNTVASFLVENCRFEENQAAEEAGAIWVLNGSDAFEAVVSRCAFINNAALTGSAISTNNEDLSTSSNPTDARLSIENCLATGNIGDNTVSLLNFPNSRLFNSTLADNLGGSLQLGGQSGLELQNSILYNPGFTEFIDLTDDALVTSLGGNLISDNSLDNWLNNTDQPAADPLLDGGYQPTQNSPAIDAGLAYDVMPEYDLAGNSRLQGSCIDIGAYESAFETGNDCKVITGLGEPLAEEPLGLFPNPASSFLKVDLPVASPQIFQLQLLDAQGKTLNRQMVSSGEHLDVEALPPGMYWIRAAVDGVAYTGKFVKL